MQSIDFEGELNRIVETDPRYDREAYVFLRQALDFCHKSLTKAGKKRDKSGPSPKLKEQLDALEESLKASGSADDLQRLKEELARGKDALAAERQESHVSVAELLDGVRQYALQEYGPMAMMVLNSWGVKSCEDFGEIVFKMVEHRLLSVTEQDTREEFRKGFEFFGAFRAPFKPAKGKSSDKPAAEPSST
jgi:uncharacterized repeat protein (TIGR04138 family)